MSDISSHLAKLIGEAANKGQVLGLIRKEAIAWCKGNVVEDCSGIHPELHRQLVERHNQQVIRFETSSLVQAVDIRKIVPLSKQHSSCACWKEEILECGLCEYSAEDRAFIAGTHHAESRMGGDSLKAVAVTAQFDQPGCI